MTDNNDDDEIEAKSVAGVTFDGTTTGTLDESAIPTEGFESHYLYDGENKSNSTYPVVGANNKLYKGNVRSAQSVGARGGVSDASLEKKLKSLADEFDPPIKLSGTEEDDEAEAELVEGRISCGDVARDDEMLRGTIWAAGEHSLKIGGQPTRVHVPGETVDSTFERLKSRITRGEVSIGFDHPNTESVAASTPVGELGTVNDVSLDSSGEKIVMTDSVVTNNKAREAIEAGDFDGYDYSIVGSYKADPSADAPDDADVVLTEVDIRRVDVVREGAVRSANVNRNVPTLAAKLADASADRPAAEIADALRAAAGTDIGDSDTEMKHFDTNPDDIEAAKEALSDAADVIDEKDEQNEDLEAKVSDLDEYRKAFERVAMAFDLEDVLDDKGVEAATSAAVDVVTEDLREEIAELEAELPGQDTGSDEIEARVEELAGTHAEDLEARAGKLARDWRKADITRSNGSNAIAASESGTSLGGSGGAEDEMARWALDPIEEKTAEESGKSPSEYIKAEYGGIEASDCRDRHELQQKMSEYRRGGN